MTTKPDDTPSQEANPERRLLSALQVAERFGCTRSNVLQLRVDGRITGLTVGGRVWFEPEEVERALLARSMAGRLATRDAAALLGCTEDILRRRAEQGLIPRRAVGRSWTYDPVELEAFKATGCFVPCRGAAPQEWTSRAPSPWPDGLLSTEDVARRLGISRGRLHQLISAGRIHGRKHGSRWTFTGEAVDSFLKRRAETSSIGGMFRLLQAQAQAQVRRRAKLKQARQARLDAEAPQQPAFVLSPAMRNWPILDDRDRLRGTRY